MKKTVIIAIASMLVFGQGAWAQTTSFPRHGETGENSESNPYIISSVEDLNALAADVNSGTDYENVCFKLTTALNYSNEMITDGSNYTPIGIDDNEYGKPFKGVFDGGDNVINGITVYQPGSSDVGLFGLINGATIKNIKLSNCHFTGNYMVGAIVGESFENGAIISNCHVDNTVYVIATLYNDGVDDYPGSRVGGIIGFCQCTLVSECTSAGIITGDNNVGGIVGELEGENKLNGILTNCFYVGKNSDITGSTDKGIIFGSAENYTINITLLNDDSNATVKNATRIANYNGEKANVTLSDRTLYKDGKWNTLCLPFGLAGFTGTPLEGATVKALISSAFNNGNGELTLNFTEDAYNLTQIDAGTPYIVKWTGTDVSDPVFNGVTINNVQDPATSTDKVDFVGSFSPVSLVANDKNKLYLGANNTLYYPSAAMTIGACRAYFQLNGLTVGEQTLGAKKFVLNFGEEETTGIVSIEDEKLKVENGAGAWFTLDGRKLSGKPTRKGVYVNNGRKVVVK